jgi:hypothetical protein
LKALILALAALTVSAALPAKAAEADPQEAAIVNRYLSATREQQSTLRGVSMEVDIDAKVPKLQKQGKLHALRNISKLGKITYHMLGFNGDNAIKKEVIARYLSAEVQSQDGENISITPANYKFKYKGVLNHDSEQVYIFQLSPRKKRVGLFKGELWLDVQTCMPVRESGRFVKTPSIFLKKMEFTRVYAMQDGVSIPQYVESRVDTRLFGQVELTINFTHFSREPEGESVVATAAGDTQ